MIDLPLPQSGPGLLGEQLVDDAHLVALVRQDAFQLEDVGTVAAHVELAEEGEFTFHGHGGSAVEREDDVAGVDGVAVVDQDRADSPVDARGDALELVAADLTANGDLVGQVATLDRRDHEGWAVVGRASVAISVVDDLPHEHAGHDGDHERDADADELPARHQPSAASSAT